MEFRVSYHTDKGIKKSTNQDALLIRTIRTKKGRLGLFAVCDGMGGLEKGELASGTVINELNKWFENELTTLINESNEEILNSIMQCISNSNTYLINYSKENCVKLGTTLTAFLCLYDKYYTIQIGDSRLYKFNDEMNLLTKDQTFVAREVERGNITLEEAKVHPKRNVLLQCIGVLDEIEPVITEGSLEQGAIYLVCSDGLHHKLLDKEMQKIFSNKNNNTKEKMDRTVIDVIELVKKREEVDNITAILINII